MKMMKQSLLLLGLFSSLFANEVNKTQIFMDKYLPNQTEIKQSIDVKIIKKRSSDINISKFHKIFDKNNSKKLTKGVKFIKSNKADKVSKEIKNNFYSDKFQTEVKKSEDYILYDKEWNYQKYLGKYGKLTKEIINKNNPLNNNQFLDCDEKLYMVISSSMPTQTIKNYFKEVQPVNTDITFVMRGTIGGIHKIKPTLKWLNNIVVIDKNKNSRDKKNRYQINLEINPKVTRRYNIKRVPALIYIQNFNPIIEMQEPMPKDDDKKEKVYIAYGDSNIEYSLQKINKKVKSRGIERFLKSMKQSFFNK